MCNQILLKKQEVTNIIYIKKFLQQINKILRNLWQPTLNKTVTNITIMSYLWSLFGIHNKAVLFETQSVFSDSLTMYVNFKKPVSKEILCTIQHSTFSYICVIFTATVDTTRQTGNFAHSDKQWHQNKAINAWSNNSDLVQ